MDWQRYRLPIMGVLAVAMVGATWWAVNENTGDTHREESSDSGPTLPEVDTDALTEITIFRPEEDETITLTRADEGWRLTAPVETAAAQTAVNTVLDKLGDLEIAGRAASSATHHEDMQVDAAHGIRVTANAGSETVIDLYIGAFRAGNTLVRQEGEDTVLMVRGSIKFAFNKPPRDFRDRSMTELSVGEVSHITFENENGRFAFYNDGSDWQQNLTAAEGEEPPAAIEDFAGAKVRTMVSSLARLRASDFAAADATPDSLGFGEGAARVILGMTPEAEGDAEGDDSEGEDGDDAEGEDAEGAGAARGPDSVPETTLTLTIGNEESDGKRYVMVEGNETIFIVSRFIAERLLPEAEAFTASAEEPTPPPAPGGMPPGMPPGMPGGAGGPGGGQIPPELMQQIQRQLQQQGAGGGGHGGGGHP